MNLCKDYNINRNYIIPPIKIINVSSIISQASDVIIRAKANHNVHSSIHPHPCIFYLLCIPSRYCKNNYSHLASALIQILLKQ